MERKPKNEKPNRISSLRFASLCALALSACASAPPAVPLCVELTLDRAYCVNTITSEEFPLDDEHKLDGQTYWEMRPTMLLVPASSWARIKAWIIKECKVTGACDARMTGWDRTVEKVDQITARGE